MKCIICKKEIGSADEVEVGYNGEYHTICDKHPRPKDEEE